MPTIEEDLTTLACGLAPCVGSCTVENCPMARIRAYHAHLEAGVALLVESTDGSDSWEDWPRLAKWMAAERARKARP